MRQVAYYIRTSTADQTPELQIRDLDKICNEPHDIYKENQSAWSEYVIRPVFNKIKELIQKGKITDLYVWDLDRLQRNRKKLQQFFILCKSYGCTIHSYRQEWLEAVNKIPSPFNEIVHELLINVFGWIAEEESSKKSERIKMAVKKRVDGTYSHLGNKWGRKSFPKQTVTRVLELYMEGKSVRQIAALIKVYDKHKNERPISKSAVHKIIVENTPKKGS